MKKNVQIMGLLIAGVMAGGYNTALAAMQNCGILPNGEYGCTAPEERFAQGVPCSDAVADEQVDPAGDRLSVTGSTEASCQTYHARLLFLENAISEDAKTTINNDGTSTMRPTQATSVYKSPLTELIHEMQNDSDQGRTCTDLIEKAQYYLHLIENYRDLNDYWKGVILERGNTGFQN